MTDTRPCPRRRRAHGPHQWVRQGRLPVFGGTVRIEYSCPGVDDPRKPCGCYADDPGCPPEHRAFNER